MDLRNFKNIMKWVTHVPVAASSGSTTLVTGVSGKRIVLLQCALFAESDSTISFKSGSTLLSGICNLFANPTAVLAPSTGAMVLPFSACGWAKTADGETFSIDVTGGDMNGFISYAFLDV